MAQSHNQPKKHDKKEEGCTTKLEKGVNKTVFLKKRGGKKPSPNYDFCKRFSKQKRIKCHLM